MMTSPHSHDEAALDATICIFPGCERPAVRSAQNCRLHLAEAMRAGGRPTLFDDPELSAMYAAAAYLAEGAIHGLPVDMLRSEGPWTELAMGAGIRSDGQWALAQAGMDLFGTSLADEHPFGAMQLFPPRTLPDGNVLLDLRVGLPTAALPELQPRLAFAFEALIREFVDDEDIAGIVVGEPGVSDGS